MSPKIGNNRFIPIEPVGGSGAGTRPRGPHRTARPDFGELLNRQMEGPSREIKVSAHAQQRLEERNIRLSDQDMGRMSEALDAVEQKGGRNSVVFFRDTAFIASVPNRTLITAIGLEEDLQVMTNIDSTVHIKVDGRTE